jgi:hypothetical protein
MLRLLKEDEEFRYAVAGLLGLEEILKRLDRNEQELVRLREDMAKMFERHEERFARIEEEIGRIWQEIAKLREDMVKGFERHDREIERLTEELTKLREDMVKGFERHDRELERLREDMIKGFERHDAELAKLREDMVKGFERHDREIQRLTEEMNKLREDMTKGFELVNRHISAIGARWGIMAEDAFREGLRGILEKEFGVKVDRWIARDEDGMVYGFSSVIEIDIAIKDGKTMLIEISSSVDKSKVAAFLRKAQLYEKKTGIKPERLIMVTPYADEDAIEAAREVGVEVYTRV